MMSMIITSADLREEWFQSHDPMGFIGVDRNANTAAANMHIPLSMFVQPQAPPYYAVSILMNCTTVPLLSSSPWFGVCFIRVYLLIQYIC